MRKMSWKQVTSIGKCGTARERVGNRRGTGLDADWGCSERLNKWMDSMDGDKQCGSRGKCS